MNKIIFLFLFFTFCIYSQDTLNINNIPNPKLNNSNITVIGNYLNQQEINEINKEIVNIEKETSIEICVVILPKSGGDIFSLAQNIFDKWGIGKKGKDNGILIISAIEDREFRTHTGYGIEPILPDGKIRILQDKIVIPYFKKGEYGKGIIEYIKELKAILVNNYKETELTKDNYSINQEKSNEQLTKIINENITKKFIRNLIIAIIIIIIGFLLIYKDFIKFKKISEEMFNRYTEIKNLIDKGFEGVRTQKLSIVLFLISILIIITSQSINIILNLIIILIPAFGLFLSVKFNLLIKSKKDNIIKKWRTEPRKCPECDGTMTKLNEQDDDKYLNEIQRVEEKLETYDYDVWVCNNCPNKTIEQYKSGKYTFYTVCPKCNGLTSKQTKSYIVKYPTYNSNGLKKIVLSCIACNHIYEKSIIIPKLERERSSYSGYSRSSSGYSFRSSGSSSYKSSGSSGFGGGRSGGGGATSKW